MMLEDHLRAIMRLDDFIQNSQVNDGIKAIASDYAAKARLDLAAIDRGSSCEEKAKIMPSFTLVASDPIAEPVISLWIDIGRLIGVKEDKLSAAARAQREIEVWKRENKNDCKIPD
jgi:hypothetical protein